MKIINIFKKYSKIIILILCIFFIIYYKNNEGFNTQRKNIAFYTVFTGTDANIAFKVTQVPSENYDSYYYTNNKKLLDLLKDTKWIPMYLDIPITDDEVQSAMDSKHLKIVPSDYPELNKYDYTVYLDSKVTINSIEYIESLIDKYMPQYSMLVLRHEFLKGKVWDEFNESMKQPRYKREEDKYFNYINKQLSNGLSHTTPDHYTTKFIIRNMKSPVIKEINDTWYEHTKECGIECQISFFFAKQLYINDIYPIEKIE